LFLTISALTISARLIEQPQTKVTIQRMAETLQLSKRLNEQRWKVVAWKRFPFGVPFVSVAVTCHVVDGEPDGLRTTDLLVDSLPNVGRVHEAAGQ
jgi:hypothetical protein